MDLAGVNLNMRRLPDPNASVQVPRNAYSAVSIEQVKLTYLNGEDSVRAWRDHTYIDFLAAVNLFCDFGNFRYSYSFRKIPFCLRSQIVLWQTPQLRK